MPQPSQLSIATSSVLRLVKEEKSYHKELEMQEKRIAKVQDDKDDENADFRLRQEKMALEETKAVFPNLRKRMEDHLVQLEKLLQASGGEDEDEPSEEVIKARDVVAQAKALRDAPAQ